jgi:hypothetical protein
LALAATNTVARRARAPPANWPSDRISPGSVADFDQALGTAALAARFADNDVIRILAHQRENDAEPTRASETHSLQPGTSACVGAHAVA